MNRAEDWLRQAERDLHQAQLSMQNGVHEWACFAAQQAAEKAVKALHLQLGQEAWGQPVMKLLQRLPEGVEVAPELLEGASILDSYYIPPRYPNGFSEGAPYEYYTCKQSEEAIRYARAILEFACAEVARRRERASGGQGVG